MVEPASTSPPWWLYHGTGEPLPLEERDARWPEPPPWRTFRGTPDVGPAPDDDGESTRRLGRALTALPVRSSEVAAVNTALALRRPLLITGRPGSGKTTLAYRVARELRLGRVLRWAMTSRTTLRSGLYEYDAIGRAQANSAAGGDTAAIGDYIHLGPLGTALLPRAIPRVLLIDEMDRCSVDLPGDLREIIEEGEFAIPELVRVRNLARDVTVHTADHGGTAVVRDGVVRCREFPLTVITSNDERMLSRDFRYVHYDVPDPDDDWLAAMVAAHFPAGSVANVREILRMFRERSDDAGGLAADSVLNAVHLARGRAAHGDNGWDQLLDALWRHFPERES